MKSKILISIFVLTSLWSAAQVGFNCQYAPGLQFGLSKVKSDITKNNYSYRVGMPVMLIDYVSDRWYWNTDMTGVFYMLSATNKSKTKEAQEDLARTDGALFGFRMGRMFGEKDNLGGDDALRIGFSLNAGYNQVNIDSTKLSEVSEAYSYGSYGLGLVVYKKFKEFHTMGKIGYEVIAKKPVKGKCIYLEGTLGMKIYQKFGISVMPGMYFRSFDKFNDTDKKVKSSLLTLRFGFTKFF
ncbi:MAG: hypothetical protein A2275_01875 [Bacteroidetes bacterium RIFOXYA12_FULL_35_11]|nr:MAG: hypothetical protein A2X01_16310 [Bacteroidetes bacterium GWF2_35_48]OFY75324.1 MAG: hypothetical protein A2275_01875 [Bacteroidetes bacterium RIFOXYA12_FULL_35_11]OFY94821.1 MAG: hypothetical protein A2491_14375 [Bacteroidetes bacterium RIFOXYC12_FULL_35_7]OFY96917.1 MAG: hypothetical protein A2309_08255 [Bacteroidetes bacterium RIFOXYB2_FULL_35_7]HBX53475.1 hypothetical protein [Bacteroidales bacterium]